MKAPGQGVTPSPRRGFSCRLPHRLYYRVQAIRALAGLEMNVVARLAFEAWVEARVARTPGLRDQVERAADVRERHDQERLEERARQARALREAGA